MKKNQFHVVKDPVHGTMQFTSQEDRWIKPFINSKGMQRLRHIKQLGFADYIFPGAVHTRFNHSLGCCYVGSQIANKIEMDVESKQTVMIACLLHDIGHGPFSHAFEGLFVNELIHHEAWTPFFLSDYQKPEFFDSYNKLKSDTPLSLNQFEEIQNMIMHRPVKEQLLADIVSSQLDADRLDYLLRDSHFCGVNYGQFDFRWMLHCLTIITHNGRQHLGITQKGIGVFESYLMARRLIIRNIGHAAKKLAIEKLLIDLLRSLSESMINETTFNEVKNTRLGRFLLAVSQYNEKVKKSKQPEVLTQRFLEDNFKEYRELCDYDVYRLIRHLSEHECRHEVVEMARRIQWHEMPQIIMISHVDEALVRAELNQFLEKNSEVSPWQCQFITTPGQAYSDAEPVWVSDEEGEIHPITTYSLMVDMLSDRMEKVEFLMIDKNLAENQNVKKWVKKIRDLSETQKIRKVSIGDREIDLACVEA